MNKSRRHALEFALAMGATSAFAHWAKAPTPEANVDSSTLLSAIIPMSFGEWSVAVGSHSVVRLASRDERLYNAYDQLLERTFSNSAGYRIMLSIASSFGAQAMQLHWPEVCYESNGYKVGPVEASSVVLAGHEVATRRLFAQLPGRPEPVTYWSVVAGKIVAGPGSIGFGSWNVRLARIEHALRREALLGTLVRCSSIDANPQRAYAIQASFADAMVGALAADHQHRIIGSGVDA